MKKFLASLLFLLFLLTACGPLDVHVEPIATPTPLPSPTALPTPRPIVPTPTSPRVITATPSRAPQTPTASGPDLRFKPGTALKIVSTHMLTAQTGWGVGESDQDLVQHILFTQDGGGTWRDATPPAALTNVPEGGLLATTWFASAENAWVIYAARAPGTMDPKGLIVWHTADNGQTWSAGQPLDLAGVNMEFESPSDLGFLDASHGWLMVHLGVGMSHDYFAAFTTADGGTTWKRILDPSTTIPIMSCVKSGLTFTSAANGWITGNCPGLMPKLFIFRTTDSGATWSEATLPVPPGKAANYFASGIACGINAIDYSSARSLALTLTCTNYNNNTAQSWLYGSNDAGATWSERLLPALYTRIDLLNADEGFLVGSMKSDPEATGAVYHTANGGADWAITTSTGWTGQPDFVDAQTGWVVAIHGQVTAFVRTTDGGRTWVEIKPVVG